MRPTCLHADKNLSTETNLQRSHSPATNQDFLGTTNKKCFSWDKLSINFKRRTWFAFHYFVATELCRLSHVPTHEFRVFDQMFPFFGGATQITLTLSTMGMGQDSISGAAIKIMMPNYMAISPKHFCANSGFG